MNIKNGVYIKANIIELSVSDKSYTNKKTGEMFRIYTLVVDEGGTAQKKFIKLNSDQITAGLHEKLSHPKFKGIQALIPVWCGSYKDKVQFNYAGTELPLLTQKQEAQSA